MRLSTRGIPILTMHEKLLATAHCIAKGHNEDAAGHLCDLLANVGAKLAPSSFRADPWKTLKAVVVTYGSRPTPIDEEP